MQSVMGLFAALLIALAGVGAGTITVRVQLLFVDVSAPIAVTYAGTS